MIIQALGIFALRIALSIFALRIALSIFALRIALSIFEAQIQSGYDSMPSVYAHGSPVQSDHHTT